jgi:hypothetical protein
MIAGAVPALAAPASHSSDPLAPATSGTQLLNCAASPHACGYPDATSTGVPLTAHLLSVPGQVASGPGWKYDPRGWVEVSGNGASLSNLYIPYNLDISASNVTINNVKVVTGGTGNTGISLRHTSNVTIENSSVYGPENTGPNRLQYGIKDIYADSSGTVIEGNNIWNTATGIAISEGTVQNNYIHDFGYYTGDHDNGIASKAGDPAGLYIAHNTVLNPLGQTDAIQLSQDFGPQLDCTITGNLLAGGGYTVYGGASGAATPVNIVITNNRFARMYYPKSGQYGTDAYVSTTGPGDVWSGNTWDDTGVIVNP